MKSLLYEGPLLFVILSISVLFAMSVAETQRPLETYVSTDKYEYVVGETVTIRFFISVDCEVKLIVTRPDQSTSVNGPYNVTAGTHSVIATAWYPLGPRRVVSEARGGGLKGDATCYFIVTNEKQQELYSTPTGGRTYSGNIYNSSLLLLSIDFDPNASGDQQAISTYPGEIVSVRDSYWVWTPSIVRLETARWQLFLFCSWTPQWPPPASHYFLIYNGTPGSYPGTQGANTFSIHAPMCPGTYYLWFVCSMNASSEQALDNFRSPMTLPAHAKIVVKQRQPTALVLEASPSSVALGEGTTLNGKINVTLSEGTKVQIWYSTNATTFSKLVEVAADSNGKFSFRWTPPSMGTYFMKASWQGDTRYAGAESRVVELTVASSPKAEWTYFLIVTSSVIIFVSLVLAMKKRKQVPEQPPKDEVEKYIAEVKNYLGSLTLDEIRERLKRLEMIRKAGEIDEQTYLKLKQEYEKRLAEIAG